MPLRVVVISSLLVVTVLTVVHPGGGLVEASSSQPAEGPLPLERVRGDPVLSEHLEFMRLDSRALRQNLLGDPHVRELGVLLPPSYFAHPDRRFPVVYLLHGLGQRRDGHLGYLDVQRAAFEEMTAGTLAEFILVAVDGTTSLGGSYYANSPTIGDFETYVVREIVGAVDAHYRTWADAGRRVLAGFSMGGHGVIKLVLKHPGVFSAVGTLSASPLAIADRKALYRNALREKPRAERPAELEALYPFDGAWTMASIYAKAAAFSPNPSRPTLFLDLPFESGMGEDDPVWQRWTRDDPLTLLSENPRALRHLDTLYMDRGDQERILGAEAFDRELARHRLPWRHHVFAGGHSDDFHARHLRMLRYLSMRWQPGA